MIGFEKIDVNINTSQMEQWSILANILNYVQYNRNPIDYFKVDIRALEPRSHRRIYDKFKKEDRWVIYLNFGDTPDKLKGEYLNVFERFRSEILYNKKCDEISDFSTTYLGKVNMHRPKKIPISEQSYALRNYKVMQSVRYLWTVGQVSLLCPKHIIWDIHQHAYYWDLFQRILR